MIRSPSIKATWYELAVSIDLLKLALAFIPKIEMHFVPTSLHVLRVQDDAAGRADDGGERREVLTELRTPRHVDTFEGGRSSVTDGFGPKKQCFVH